MSPRSEPNHTTDGLDRANESLILLERAARVLRRLLDMEHHHPSVRDRAQSIEAVCRAAYVSVREIEWNDGIPTEEDMDRIQTALDARTLAAELVRAADEVESVTERSCFTCAHADGVECAVQFGPDSQRIDRYISAACGPGGMPKDRSIPCPGWSAKVTT